MQSLGELEVYEAGELTVVGFGGRTILDHLNIASCRDELMELVQENDCRTLAFDLTGVPLIPSGLLGVLASIHAKGIGIQIYNPSDDVLEVLEITKLDTLFEIHNLEV
jgi:anti-anti-sigma factor